LFNLGLFGDLLLDLVVLLLLLLFLIEVDGPVVEEIDEFGPLFVLLQLSSEDEDLLGQQVINHTNTLSRSTIS
jgi:hypothetical protein